MGDEKKRVLKLVEEGKITASEALALLELLEKEQEQKNVKEKEIIHELANVVNLDDEEKKEQAREEAAQKKIASAKDMIFSFSYSLNLLMILTVSFMESVSDSFRLLYLPLSIRCCIRR